MKNINLEYYKIFYYTAKYRNMTKAAAFLYLTQPAVSHSIAQLEHALQCRLFQRTPKGVNLTQEGEILYAQAAKALDSLSEARQRIERLVNYESGEVRIGASDTALHFYLLDKLESFRHEYPGIHISILNTTTPLIQKALSASEIDVGIVASPAEPPMGCQVTTVAPIQDIFIAGEEFSDLAGQPLKPEDLSRYPLICISPASGSRAHYDHYFAAHNLTLLPEFNLSTSDLILPFVKRNLGIGILPSYFAEESIRSGQVTALDVIPPIPPRNIQVLTPPAPGLSPAVRLFLQDL